MGPKGDPGPQGLEGVQGPTGEPGPLKKFRQPGATAVDLDYETKMRQQTVSVEEYGAVPGVKADQRQAIEDADADAVSTGRKLVFPRDQVFYVSELFLSAREIDFCGCTIKKLSATSQGQVNWGNRADKKAGISDGVLENLTVDANGQANVVNLRLYGNHTRPKLRNINLLDADQYAFGIGALASPGDKADLINGLDVDGMYIESYRGNVLLGTPYSMGIECFPGVTCYDWSFKNVKTKGLIINKIHAVVGLTLSDVNCEATANFNSFSSGYFEINNCDKVDIDSSCRFQQNVSGTLYYSLKIGGDRVTGYGGSASDFRFSGSVDSLAIAGVKDVTVTSVANVTGNIDVYGTNATIHFNGSSSGVIAMQAAASVDLFKMSGARVALLRLNQGSIAAFQWTGGRWSMNGNNSRFAGVTAGRISAVDIVLTGTPQSYAIQADGATTELRLTHCTVDGASTWDRPFYVSNGAVLRVISCDVNRFKTETLTASGSQQLAEEVDNIIDGIWDVNGQVSSKRFKTIQEAINHAVTTGRQLVIEHGTKIPQVSWAGRLDLFARGVVYCEYDGKNGPWMRAAPGADGSGLVFDCIDYQGNGVLGLMLDAPRCKVYVKAARNMTAQDYSIANRQGVVVSQAADCEIDVTAYDFSMGPPQGANAVPRVVTTDGGSIRNKVRVKAYHCHTVWIENGVNNTAEYVIADSCTDNGIYNLDNSQGMKCVFLQYTNGKDEAFVLKGKSPWIGKAIFDGWSFPGVQNCSNAVVDEIFLLPTPDGKPSTSALRSRDGNVQSDIRIGRITGDLTVNETTAYAQGALFQFYVGAVDIRVKTIDLRVKWAATSCATNFILHRNGSIAEYGDVRLQFDDADGKPAQAMYWGRPPAPARFVLANTDFDAKDYEWLKISDVNTSNVLLPAGQEINGSVLVNPSTVYPQNRTVTATAAPTSGSWNRGDTVLNKFPSTGGATGWRCIASGTPGTWRLLGQAGVGKGTTRPTAVALGLVNDSDMVGAEYLDTSIDAQGKYIKHNGTTWVDVATIDAPFLQTDAASGAVPIPLADAVRERVSVKRFGAVTGGDAKDGKKNWNAFQKAILYLMEKGGGTVEVGRGRYALDVSVPLIVPSRISFAGEVGASIIVPDISTVVDVATRPWPLANGGVFVSGNPLTGERAVLDRGTGCVGIHFYGIEIECDFTHFSLSAGKQLRGFAIYDTVDTSISHCRAENLPNTGINFQGCIDFRIVVNRAIGNGFGPPLAVAASKNGISASGLALPKSRAQGSTGGVVSENVSRYNADEGIQYGLNGNIVLSSNVCIGNGDLGIEGDTSFNVTATASSLGFEVPSRALLISNIVDGTKQDGTLGRGGITFSGGNEGSCLLIANMVSNTAGQPGLSAMQLGGGYVVLESNTLDNCDPGPNQHQIMVNAKVVRLRGNTVTRPGWTNQHSAVFVYGGVQRVEIDETTSDAVPGTSIQVQTTNPAFSHLIARSNTSFGSVADGLLFQPLVDCSPALVSLCDNAFLDVNAGGTADRRAISIKADSVDLKVTIGKLQVTDNTATYAKATQYAVGLKNLKAGAVAAAEIHGNDFGAPTMPSGNRVVDEPDAVASNQLFERNNGLPGQRVAQATAAPTTGSWYRGDTVLNPLPSSGGATGWRCVATGTPGVWRLLGQSGVGKGTARPTAVSLGFVNDSDMVGAEYIDTSQDAQGRYLKHNGTTWLDIAAIATNSNVVNSSNELRALSGKTSARAQRTGYYAAGDGGGGRDFVLGAPGSATDDGISVFTGPDGPWIVEQVGDMTFSQCGALGNYDDNGNPVKDETQQLQAAFTWAAKRGATIRAQPSQRFLASKTLYAFLPGNFQFDGARIVAASGFKADKFSYGSDPAYPVLVISGKAGTVSPATGTAIQNFSVIGPYGGAVSKPPNLPLSQYVVLDGILVCGDYAQISDAKLMLMSEGFRDSLIVGGSHCYLVDFTCPSIGKAWRRGWRWLRVDDTGENFHIHGGKTFNCVNSAGTAVGMYEDGTTNLDAGIYSHSFDYCDRSMELRSGIWTTVGCHWENNNNNPHVRLFKTNQMPGTHLRVIGGSIGGGPLGTNGPYIPNETFGGRPYLIGLNGDVSLDFNSKISGFSNVNTSVAVKESGNDPVKVYVRGYSDWRSNQSSGLAVPWAGSNRLYNGGFETGSFDGWNCVGLGNVFSIDSTDPRTGKYCCQIQLADPAASSSAVQDITTVSANQVYVVGGWIKSPDLEVVNGGYVTIRVQFLTKDAKVIDDGNTGAITGPTDGYQQTGKQFIVPVGASIMRVQCYVLHTTSPVRFDDVFACPI